MQCQRQTSNVNVNVNVNDNVNVNVTVNVNAHAHVIPLDVFQIKWGSTTKELKGVSLKIILEPMRATWIINLEPMVPNKKKINASTLIDKRIDRLKHVIESIAHENNF